MAGYFVRVHPVERVPNGNLTGGKNYVAGLVAPHGTTTRWTYTVPTGSAAQLENAMVGAYRDVAPGAAGEVVCNIDLSPGGHLLRINVLGAAVGAGKEQNVGLCGFLLAGETATGQTSDASTGGSGQYSISIRYREFVI